MQARDAYDCRATPPARSRSPRLGGGRRQVAREAQRAATSSGSREAQRVATPSQSEAESDYRRAVYDLFLKNEMSGKGIQSLAAKAQAAGARGAERVAAAGAGGKHQKNFSRDIMRFCCACGRYYNLTGD